MNGDGALTMVQSRVVDKAARPMSHRSAVVKILESRPHTQKEIQKILKESFGIDLPIGTLWGVLNVSLKNRSLRGKVVECKKIGKHKQYYLVDQSENDQPDGDLDQVDVDNDGVQSPVEPVTVQNGDVSDELVVPQEIKLSPEEEINMADELGLEWASLISDLNRTGHCETLAGDQRRAALLGGYHDKGLPSNKIASSIDKPVKEVKSHLRYCRFINNTDKSITSNINKQKFQDYWAQVVDPQDMKNRSKLDAADEQSYFKFIEGLVADGKEPVKIVKKLAPPDASTMKTILSPSWIGLSRCLGLIVPCTLPMG